MGAAEELNKPSPFGQEEGKWTALRNDLNGNLEAIVQEVQVHHLDLGGRTCRNGQTARGGRSIPGNKPGDWKAGNKLSKNRRTSR
jgi:hypothetical protein